MCHNIPEILIEQTISLPWIYKLFNCTIHFIAYLSISHILENTELNNYKFKFNFIYYLGKLIVK